MDEVKRLARRAEDLPAGDLTEWDQGFVAGVNYGRWPAVVDRISRKVIEALGMEID